MWRRQSTTEILKQKENFKRSILIKNKIYKQASRLLKIDSLWQFSFVCCMCWSAMVASFNRFNSVSVSCYSHLFWNFTFCFTIYFNPEIGIYFLHTSLSKLATHAVLIACWLSRVTRLTEMSRARHLCSVEQINSIQYILAKILPN